MHAVANVQKMLYDSDAGALNTAVKRRFTVRDGLPVKISAAGLAAGECVAVYTYIGSSTGLQNCGDCVADEPDFKWTPLVRCGVPVTLCDTNMEYVEKVPGLYSVGDPAAALTFAGDVNITALELGSGYLDVPFCEPQSGTPAPVEVVSSCAEPVFVELCNAPTTLIETALAELGCVFNPDGTLLGKVIIQRIDDEDAGTFAYVQTLFQTDGTVVSPYTGPWTVCEAPTVLTNQSRHSGILAAGSTFDLLAAVTPGATLISYTINFLDTVGTVDGVPVPQGSWSWAAEDRQELTNPPTAITSVGSIYVQWTERS